MKVPPWIEMSRPRAQAGRRLDIFLTHCGYGFYRAHCLLVAVMHF